VKAASILENCASVSQQSTISHDLDQMAGLIGKLRRKQRPIKVDDREKENPYAIATEFPREILFDGELKLLLMDGSVEFIS
jgi:hypothetical protein